VGDFREATRNSAVAFALGDLVTSELDRYRARRVREGSADEQELLKALEARRSCAPSWPNS
jgi:hypothetical protein